MFSWVSLSILFCLLKEPVLCFVDTYSFLFLDFMKFYSFPLHSVPLTLFRLIDYQCLDLRVSKNIIIRQVLQKQTPKCRSNGKNAGFLKKNMWFFFPVFSIPWYLLRLPRRVLTLDSNLSWLPLPAGTQTTSLPYIVLQSQASPMDQCDLLVTELASSLITQFQIYLQLKGKKRILFLPLGWYTMMSFVTNPFFLFARCVQTEGVHIA